MITTAMLQLSERDRQLVILYHLKGFNYKELSTLFEIPEGTLRVILCRALKKLGSILKKNGYELNSSGGEIKGNPEMWFEQSSTLANIIDWELDDAKIKI